MPLDVAVVGEFAQHVLELGAVGVLGAEFARDLAGADLAGALADEGEMLLARGEGGSSHGPLIGRIRPKKQFWPVVSDYSAACVDLRGALAVGGPFAVSPGRLDDALMCRAVPGEGRLALRGRACGAGPLRSALASIRAAASSSVIVSGVLSLGSVALTPSWLT